MIRTAGNEMSAYRKAADDARRLGCNVVVVWVEGRDSRGRRRMQWQIWRQADWTGMQKAIFTLTPEN